MEEKFREILAFNIKIERIRAKMTQESLAEKVEISTKHITKIESAKFDISLIVNNANKGVLNHTKMLVSL